MNESNLFDRLESLNKAPEQIGGDAALAGNQGAPRGTRKPNRGPGVNLLIVFRILIAAALWVLSLLLSVSEPVRILILAASALAAGYDIVIDAAHSLQKLQFFSIQVLMTLAAVFAFLIGKPVDAAAALIICRLSLLLQDYAAARIKESVRELTGLQTSSVTVLRDGRQESVPAGDVEVGEMISILPGEHVSVNCVVEEGNSRVDVSAVTGNSLPRLVGAHDTLLAGFVNLNSVLLARVMAKAEDSTASLIREAMESSTTEKTHTEERLERLFRLFAPAALLVGLAVTLLQILVFDILILDAVRRFLIFFIAASIGTVPIFSQAAYFAGIGGALRKGILFRRAAVMDVTAESAAVVFDKAGTLSTGKYRVVSAKSDRMDSETLLKVAAHVTARSSLSFAAPLAAACKAPVRPELLEKFAEFPEGVLASVGGVYILVGLRSFLREMGVHVAEEDGEADMTVFLAVNKKYAGRILLSDPIKLEAADAVQELAEAGCERISLLSGDSCELTARFAKSAGIQEYRAEADADEKTEFIRSVKEMCKSGCVLFVGSEADASLLPPAADVDVIVGMPGVDGSTAGADIVIMDESPARVAEAIRSARRTRLILLQSILLVLAVKLVVMALAAFGVSAQLWFAVFADMSAALVSILGSFRAYRA